MEDTQSENFNSSRGTPNVERRKPWNRFPKRDSSNSLCGKG